MNDLLNRKWSNEIVLIKKNHRLSIPLNIFLKESVALSGFIEKYWNTDSNRPGLASASPVIDGSISTEIDALAAEISKLTAEAAKKIEAESRETGVSLKARQWLQELHHLLKWAHRYPPSGSALSIDVPKLLREYRKKGKTAAALAGWIGQDLSLVRKYAQELSNVSGLTPEFLKEGERLMDALSSVRRGRVSGSEAYQSCIKQRDALIQLLQDRITRVRTAVRFVFRNHPQIRKLAMSDFERRRRSKNRGKKPTAE